MKVHRFFYVIGSITILLAVACDQAGTAKLESNKAVIRQFSEAVNQNNLDALDEIVAANFVRHSQATPDVKVSSLEQFKEFAQASAQSIPDMNGKIEIMVAEGEYVAIYATFTGTQTGPMGPLPATGKEMMSKTMAIFRLENGKIAELWIEWDNLAMLGQLGHFPPPAVE